MYEEIVTKAIIGKGKQEYKNNYEFLLTDDVSHVLGCYIQNHKILATMENDKVRINGSFDTNIWYSFDNNTKTKVEVQRINYTELMDIHLKEDIEINESFEIEALSTKKPVVVNVNASKNLIKYEVEKELSIDILGNAKVKVQTYKNDDVVDSEIGNINTTYLG